MFTADGEYHWTQKQLVLKICPDFVQSKSLFYGVLGVLFLELCNDLR